jgi:hypothetical protein
VISITPADCTPGKAWTSFEHLLKESALFVAGPILRVGGQFHLHREHTLGSKPGIHVLQMFEAFEKQPGANQQDQREGDFGSDEGVAEPMAREIARGAAPGLFERFLEL